MPDRRHVRRVLAALAAAAVPAAVALVPHLGAGMLYLAPALVLLGLLACGCYLGERRLELLRRALRRSRAPVRAVRAIRSSRVRPARTVPRGGRLIATSLAVRPPPSLPATR